MTANAETLRCQKDRRSVIGCGVVEVLHLVVEHDGKSAGRAGDVAAEHEHDTEFAYGMQKAEKGGGYQRTAR